MSKFSRRERLVVKNLVAELSIKRIPESMIINEITRKTGKDMTKAGLFYVKQAIKKDSAKWYEQLRKGQYEFIHEYKQRIDEIEWLQQKHYEIVYKNEDRPDIQQPSLAELHKLSITLSNLHDIAPYIISNYTLSQNNNGNSLSTSQQDKDQTDPIV